MSIAWATLEHLHDVNKSRALFATHYHEMTQLSDKLDGVENATIAVKEWEGEVIFLHEVRKGRCRSVLRCAGCQAGGPARQRCRPRECGAGRAGKRRARRQSGQKAIIDDLPLFSAIAEPVQAAPTGPSDLEVALKDIHPDDLKPIEALNLLYELKEIAAET